MPNFNKVDLKGKGRAPAELPEEAAREGIEAWRARSLSDLTKLNKTDLWNGIKACNLNEAVPGMKEAKAKDKKATP